MFNFFKKDEPEVTRQDVRGQKLDNANFNMRYATSLFNRALEHLESAEQSILRDKSEIQDQIDYHQAEIASEQSLNEKLDKRIKAVTKVRKNIRKNFTIDPEVFEDEDTQTPPSEE